MIKTAKNIAVAFALLVSGSLPAAAADAEINPVGYAYMPLVLMNKITPATLDGARVQLREAKATDGCIFEGTFRNTEKGTLTFIERFVIRTLHPTVKFTDWALAIEQKRCGDITSLVNMLAPLSQAHTYLDGDGQLRPGYAAGDKVFGK